MRTQITADLLPSERSSRPPCMEVVGEWAQAMTKLEEETVGVEMRTVNSDESESAVCSAAWGGWGCRSWET